MEFQEVLRRRRMVRSFEDRPLPAAVVASLLAAAARAPSAGFAQGTEFLVLEGREETSRFWDCTLPLEKRAGFAWPGLLNAPLLVIPFSCRQAYVDRYSEPDKAVGHPMGPRWTTPYWDIDAGFSALLVLLSAVDAGLGALFFALPRPEAVLAEFGVSAGFEPVGALAVGYPAADRPSSSSRRGRRPAADTVHRGRW